MVQKGLEGRVQRRSRNYTKNITPEKPTKSWQHRSSSQTNGPRRPSLSPRVQKETRKIKITETALHEIRTGRFGRVQLPSEEEARYWLRQWREGAKLKEETPIRKIVIRRNRNEVRE